MSIIGQLPDNKEESFIQPFLPYEDKIFHGIQTIEHLEYVVDECFRKRAYLEVQLFRLEERLTHEKEIIIGLKAFHVISYNPDSEKKREEYYQSLFHSAAQLYSNPDACIAEYQARIVRLQQTIDKLNNENIRLLAKVAEIGNSSIPQNSKSLTTLACLLPDDAPLALCLP